VVVPCGLPVGAVRRRGGAGARGDRIGGARLLSEIGEHGPDQAPEVVGSLSTRPREGPRLWGDECGSVEVGLLVLLGLLVEDGPDFFARIVDALVAAVSLLVVRSCREAR